VPVLNLTVGPAGPMIDVLIGVTRARASALQMAKFPVPPPVPLRLLIDTGASGTCIEAGLLKPLGLVPKGQVPVQTPSTVLSPMMCDLFEVSVTLVHPLLPFSIETVSIVECPPIGSGIQGLLGRDLLAHCLFVYNGETGTFSLAF
jgi:hypothetical protein